MSRIQRHRLRRDREVVEAGREARQSQDAHQVFAEGLGHMAQHLLLQVAAAVVESTRADISGSKWRTPATLREQLWN